MKPPRSAKAQIRRTMTKTIKDGDNQYREKDMTIKLPKAGELVGDGNAIVSRNRVIKIAVPDTFGTSISSSCSVTLTCNQDDRTIFKAAKLCTAIIEKLVVEDMAEMTKFKETMS